MPATDHARAGCVRPPPPADLRAVVEEALRGAVGEPLERVLRELAAVRDLIAEKRKPLLTVEEVGREVGRDPYTVRTWIKGGRLRAIRVAGTGPRGRLLVPREELDRLVGRGLCRAATAPADGPAGRRGADDVAP